MKQLRINVTARDIQQARQARKKADYEACEMCPVARAVRRHDPEATVGYSACVFGKTCDLPYDAQDFIGKFDIGKKVIPFRFTL